MSTEHPNESEKPLLGLAGALMRWGSAPRSDENKPDRV
jgi:hypothetical protein